MRKFHFRFLTNSRNDHGKIVQAGACQNGNIEEIALQNKGLPT
jgi:hypothetical protein